MCNVDFHMRIGPPRRQSSIHKVFPGVCRHWCCCGFLQACVRPSKWGCRPPEGGEVIIHPVQIYSANDLSRHLNIDYALASTLMNDIDAGIKDVVVTYNIACQWSKNLFNRLSTYPHIPPLDLEALDSFRFAVPKFHLIGHGTPCQTTFNLALMDGVGMTHGESVETIWSHSTSLATWSRENGPAARHLILDDHWTGWNWSKLVGLREYFRIMANIHSLIFCRSPVEENAGKGVEMGGSPA